MCHDKTLVTWPHLTASNVEKYSFYMSGQGKKLDFLRTQLAVFFIKSIFHMSFYSLSYASPFYAFALPSQSVWMCFLTSKLNLSKHFVQKHYFLLWRICQITPAKSNLLNSHRFFFLLYILITETYILLVIWVHA